MTLAEYMRELILMNKQYGQEEELYPLINMLIRETDIVKNGNLSIRSVENAQRGSGTIYRTMLHGYASFPDLVIVDEECDLSINKHQSPEKVFEKYFDKIYACVEAKTTNYKMIRFPEGKDQTIELDYQTLLFISDKTGPGVRAKYFVKCPKSDHDDILHLVFGKFTWMDWDRIKETYSKVLKKRGLDFEDKRFEDFKEIIETTLEKSEWHKCDNGRCTDETTDERIKNRSIMVVQRIICRINKEEIKETPSGDNDDLKQLIGELLWYGDVLYTNGLEWNYLKIDDETRRALANGLYNSCVLGKESWLMRIPNKEVTVMSNARFSYRKIADLTGLYNDIVKSDPGEYPMIRWIEKQIPRNNKTLDAIISGINDMFSKQTRSEM